MLLLAVCDDMPMECADIADLIGKILGQSDMDVVIRKYISGQELLASKEIFDIIFLDIKMPELSGMDLAGKIREQGRQSLIIFVTSADEYVFEAFDVEAFQYLIKPIQCEKLEKVLKKALKKLQADADNDFLLISADRQTKKILLRDILYIESIGRIAKIHFREGTLETYEQIGILADKLSEKAFFRCHKCFLVNLDFVAAFHKTEIVLENGEKILLAKRRYDDFQRAFLSYVKGKGGII